MRTILAFALALFLPAVAQAKDHPKWVHVVATAGGSLLGEVVGAPLGALVGVAASPACPPGAVDCMNGESGMVIGASMGAALGSFGGALGGEALAGSRRMKPVLIAGGATTFLGTTAMFVGPALRAPSTYAIGLPLVTFGTPLASAIAAGTGPRARAPRAHAEVQTTPARAAVELDVAPVLSGRYRGVRVAGRF